MHFRNFKVEDALVVQFVNGISDGPVKERLMMKAKPSLEEAISFHEVFLEIPQDVAKVNKVKEQSDMGSVRGVLKR